MKDCGRCGKRLPIDCFYTRSDTGNPCSMCKDCHNKRSREWKAANPEKVRRANSTENRGPARVAEYNRRYRERNPQALAESKRRFARANPEKRRAHDAVRRAIRAGRLVRGDACERCEKQQCRIEASHHDYAKPLDVEWLCVPCHRRKDAANA